jgi:hypothetical protein
VVSLIAAKGATAQGLEGVAGQSSAVAAEFAEGVDLSILHRDGVHEAAQVGGGFYVGLLAGDTII